MTISETVPLSRGEQWTVERAVVAVSTSLAGVQRLGVAFSGGVDSSLLLALATQVLGAERVVALLGVSPSLAAEERSAAHDVAHQVGVPLVEVETHKGDRPEYQANGPDRCFHCKEELFSHIEEGIGKSTGSMPLRTGRTPTMRDDPTDQVPAPLPIIRCCGRSPRLA